MRVDAQQNREQLVEAARSLFISDGPDVPMRTVAARAGVGVATLYRHFPTREDLILGLGEQASHELAALAERFKEKWDEDPERAWQDWTTEICRIGIGSWLPRIAETHPDLVWDERVVRLRTDALAMVDEIIQLARGQGLVRDGVSALLLMASLAIISRPLTSAVEDMVPEIHRDLLATVLRGLRP